MPLIMQADVRKGSIRVWWSVKNSSSFPAFQCELHYCCLSSALYLLYTPLLVFTDASRKICCCLAHVPSSLALQTLCVSVCVNYSSRSLNNVDASRTVKDKCLLLLSSAITTTNWCLFIYIKALCALVSSLLVSTTAPLSHHHPRTATSTIMILVRSALYLGQTDIYLDIVETENNSTALVHNFVFFNSTRTYSNCSARIGVAGGEMHTQSTT